MGRSPVDLARLILEAIELRDCNILFGDGFEADLRIVDLTQELERLIPANGLLIAGEFRIKRRFPCYWSAIYINGRLAK